MCICWKSAVADILTFFLNFQLKSQNAQLMCDLENAREKHKDDVKFTKNENEEMALKLMQMKEMQQALLQVRSKFRFPRIFGYFFLICSY